MPNKDDPMLPHVSYQKNKKAIEKHADPRQLAEHLATHLQEYATAAPNISQGLNVGVMNGQQFLQSKMPQPGSSLPLSGEHKPSRTSMAKFNHYYDTVNDPIGVLSHVKKGTLKNEHLEALNAVYPKLYEEMRKKVVEHMDSDKARSLPYGTKISIAKFMGQPMDASMLPQAIMSNQAALSGPRLGAGSAMQGIGKSTLGGLKMLNLSNRTATETEQSDAADDTNIK